MAEQEPVEEELEDDDSQDQEEYSSAKNENIPRSSFFFACLSFLIAFICLGILLTGYLDFIPYLLLLLAVIVFGGVGTLFLRQNSLLNRTARARIDEESDEEEQALLNIQQEEDEQTGEERAQSPFERLV